MRPQRVIPGSGNGRGHGNPERSESEQAGVHVHWTEALQEGAQGDANEDGGSNSGNDDDVDNAMTPPTCRSRRARQAKRRRNLSCAEKEP